MSLALAGATGAYGALNGYWGQTAGPELRDYCDSGVQYATLAFVNMSPEKDRSGAGYPGINFSSHCWAETFESDSGRASQLYRNCQSLKTDIPYCQSKGVKVLLSIGGDYGKPKGSGYLSNDYEVTTDANGEYFADFLYNAFGPYRQGYTGPRPFDRPDEHVAVDGFDFDIEKDFDNGPYIAMINKFRALDKNMLITGAPQCPTDPAHFQMQGMVQKAAFDALFIQFYNNAGCNAASKSGFNLDDWVKVVSESDKSQNAKLFVGLPGSTKAGDGYIGPKEVKDLVCKYKDTKNWGGISLWDLNRAAANVIEGKGFLQHVQDALKYGCNPEPTSTSTTSASTSIYSSSWSTGTAGTSLNTTKSIPSHVTNSLRWSNSTLTSASSVPMTTSTVYTTVVLTPTAQPAEPTATQTSVALTTSTVYATRIHTITSCAPGVVDCHRGKVTTETVSLYTTVCPVFPTAHHEKPASTETSVRATIPTETSQPRVTSTLYATKIHTITSCPPEVSNCPNGKVVTQVISWVSTATPVVPASSTLERLPRPSPANPKPGHECSGPGCSAGPVKSQVGEECSGPGCPTGPSVPKAPGNGCPGLNCTSVGSVPTGRLTPSAFRPTAAPVRPSAAPAEPVTAGASSLAMGLTGLVAVVAAQLFAL
ncbi:glycosyl hydrolases family 18 domain-containing protein [Hirsutella rhossiliensis]|uniref:Glycosyl hydrolases family 18 domain-containing protein n=1 Tax=Hirsutella rhossiliensis TaxID=111463 RepID=A0A9P8MZ36_9HYPO|nr:glycosyl hydrolases family 18 domain-containing protein [Hirsutella rhossiliensis]KAH0963940.1 glycosyl hydrolases family 18 domain-containing protein [Hirsutella rhossiliensis]